MSVLRAEGLVRRFGELAALDGVSLELGAGARHALIGPNGAGKTTLIDVLSGALAPSEGEIHLCGVRVTALAQHQRVRRGLTRTFQVTSLFPSLTVLESVTLAVLEREGLGGRWWRRARDEAAALEEARSLLSALGLRAEAESVVSRLPYGRQRLLEIALGLASRPRVLLLDEPAAGIAAQESALVLEAVTRLPRETAVLFIEHDMDLVFRFAERITVLVEGRVLTEGTPGQIAADERVRAVYLGEEHG